MAVLPDYVSGTITLANGSTTVTGTGTMFEAAAFRPGDTLQIQNLTAIIASVDSNTQLTLTAPWTGTSLTNAPYRARYLPDGARVTAQTTTLIELLGNGNLQALADLPGAANQLPIFTGAGTMGLVDKSEVGIQDPHGNLGELAGLPLAARQILQTDDTGALKTTDLIADRLVSTNNNGDIAFIDPRSFSQWNLIYNGDFSINQRGGPKKPANGVYGFDMWKGHANGIQQIVEALPAGEYTLTWSGGGTGYLGSASGASPLKATVVSGNTSVVVPQTATNVSLVMGDATGRDPWMPRSHGVELFLCQRYYETGVTEGFAIHRTLAIDVVVSKIAVIFKATKRVSPTTIISYVYQDSGSWIRTHNLEGRTVDKAVAVLMTGSGGYCDVTLNWAADASL
ncbi:hypothetical protein KUG47_12190 [Falsochrobactrum sp. TDYN1]|uniref:Uncharacterized protein n=1 Tax=Falsochrobactrum tianjinense TaxID=2706015 RepID=A0A949UTN8_9HYPH|nr:hypothetical protein [Falsochrobactrum sp. TDYN1]MBV2144254.1 hypothetical protein [Falsochrobactrum sp. TDYN1]